jgi:hypothetical protein
MYLHVDPGTDVSVGVEELDEQVEVAVGPTTGAGSLIHLVVHDPHTCKRLAAAWTDAYQRLVRQVYERGPSTQDAGPASAGVSG